MSMGAIESLNRGQLTLGMRIMTGLPWRLKRHIAEHQLSWRYYAGICRRVGWRSPKAGWYSAVNGPYAGISFPANSPNDLWVPAGTYETTASAWLVRILSDDSWRIDHNVVYDVGAHRGITSLLCARHGAAIVHAFEPMPENIERLAATLQVNGHLSGQIQVQPFAVADQTGELEFETGASESEGHILRPEVAASARQPANARRFPVKCICLDDFVKEGAEPPGLVKIDIEGAEFLALKGARNTLSSHKPVLFIEIHNKAASVDCTRLLQEMEYSVCRIRSRHFLSEVREPIAYGHVLAVHRERPAYTRVPKFL